MTAFSAAIWRRGRRSAPSLPEAERRQSVPANFAMRLEAVGGGSGQFSLDHHRRRAFIE